MTSTSMSTGASNDKYSIPQHSTLEPVLHPPSQPQVYNNTGHHAKEETGAYYPKQTRNPWGLSPLAFGCLVAVLTAVIVGGAVGGGVGATLASDSDSDSGEGTSTVTVTATPAATEISSSLPSSALPSPSSLSNYLVAEPFYVESLSSECGTGTNSVSGPSGIYDISCGTDFGNGEASLEDSSLSVADMVALFAYSLLDCVYACDGTNRFLGHRGADQGFKCAALTWRSDMAAINATQNANCFLKNGTASTSNQCNSCVSAIKR